MKTHAYAGPILSLLLLSACGPSSTGPGLGGDGQYEGRYTQAGNSLVITSPGRVRNRCNGDILIKDTSEIFIDTIHFSLEGNRIRLLNRPDTVYVGMTFETEAVVQRYTDYRRVSGGTGIEGRWQGQAAGYSVLSGAVGEENKARQDQRARAVNLQLQYLTTEIEFAAGQIWVRLDGRFAEHFVADWNGLIYGETADADSAYYDIAVSVADRVTVKLKGNKTGETVTIRFEPPTGQRRYSSDHPGHTSYSTTDEVTHCPYDTSTGWYGQFRDDNSRFPFSFKKGVNSSLRAGKARKKELIPGLLP